MMRSTLSHEKLRPGYAETSTKRNPKCPTTIILSDDVIKKAVCIGTAMIDGMLDWLVFKIPGQRRYYFQFRPW